ncbi:hypothetical protein N9229_01865 [Saprospiraceae bacterium]|nr:hypothetical protein [Saprospiraceae bacterium]
MSRYIKVDFPKKSNFASIIFLVFFIMGHSFAAVLPMAFQKPYLYSIFSCYLLLGVYLLVTNIPKNVTKPVIFGSIFFVLGGANLLIHGATQTFNLVCPFAAILAYILIQKKGINVNLFNWVLILLYLFYYYVYYSILPDLFFRPFFDEDGAVFDMSSSNAIPISLNNTLYAYMIMNKYYEESNKGKIVCFSIINLVLILIQQSRAGILVAVVLCALALFEYSKKYFFTASIAVLLVSLVYIKEIVFFTEILGDINGIEAYEKDSRGEAQAQFFQNMDPFTFVFGHTEKDYSDAGFGYTYNVFLDMWDRYGVLGFGTFWGVFILRVLKRNKFQFPLYYFLPFMLYSMVESIYLPNFWDIMIYLLLFTPKLRTLTPQPQRKIQNVLS